MRQLLRDAQQAHRAQRLREAQALYAQVLEIEPTQPHAWLGMGVLALHAGAHDAACGILAKAVALAPGDAAFHQQHALALQKVGRMEMAERELQTACRLQPEAAQYWEDLGIVQQALGDTEQALESYRRADALEPSLARRIKEATVVSPIIASRESIAAERRHIETAMDALLAEPGRSGEDPLRLALWPNFYWAYHGESDRNLQTKTAAVYRHLFPSLDYVAPYCRSPQRASGSRIRAGLASQFFHNHSIGRTSRGLFAQLSREKLDVTAIFLAPAIDDEYSRFIRQHAEHSLDVPRDLPMARKLVEALRLDVLFYPDIGMDPFSYFLAFSRLAPVQCVSSGHPDTTGIPTIDYHISSEMYETPGSEEHYSERLFLLRDVGNIAYYYPPERAVQRKGRSDFGLFDEDHLYVCPQNLFKLHPDMDELIAGILRRDRLGRVVMIEGRIERWSELLKRRWAASMPEVMDRIVFLARLDSQDFVDLIEASDVMLDTRHFNGYNTSLEAFAVGTPVVTWPGEFQRGRHTQAMYRKMGMTRCIVNDAREYVDVAVHAGTDRAYRAALSGEILERKGVLFEDPDVVREFERFFEEAVGEKIPSAR
ncbi:MAG TPA: tetratricopeptide repeat protein [Casimicrobiaceae bacterium]|nr:tetratricopeptide repeat protein [Casimicrobiaceae bacterium]